MVAPKMEIFRVSPPIYGVEDQRTKTRFQVLVVLILAVTTVVSYPFEKDKGVPQKCESLSSDCRLAS